MYLMVMGVDLVGSVTKRCKAKYTTNHDVDISFLIDFKLI